LRRWGREGGKTKKAEICCALRAGAVRALSVRCEAVVNSSCKNRARLEVGSGSGEMALIKCSSKRSNRSC
jgi:hypothetical protein